MVEITLIQLESNTRRSRVYCDSQSTMYIFHTLVFHERTSHIEVDSHLISETITTALVDPSYVSNTIQIVDEFKKALGNHMFDPLLSILGNTNLHAST